MDVTAICDAVRLLLCAIELLRVFNGHPGPRRPRRSSGRWRLYAQVGPIIIHAEAERGLPRREPG